MIIEDPLGSVRQIVPIVVFEQHFEQDKTEEGFDDVDHHQDNISLGLQLRTVVAEQEESTEGPRCSQHPQVPVERRDEAEDGRDKVQHHRIARQHDRLNDDIYTSLDEMWPPRHLMTAE